MWYNHWSIYRQISGYNASVLIIVARALALWDRTWPFQIRIFPEAIAVYRFCKFKKMAAGKVERIRNIKEKLEVCLARVMLSWKLSFDKAFLSILFIVCVVSWLPLRWKRRRNMVAGVVVQARRTQIEAYSMASWKVERKDSVWYDNREQV